MLKGIAASSGIGIGKAVIVKQHEIAAPRRPIRDAGLEMHRFFRAVDVFCTQLTKATALASQTFGESEIGIINAQIIIIRDPDLHGEIERRIRDLQENIELAFEQVLDRYVSLFSQLEDDLMRARAADFSDIKGRLLRILLGMEQPEMPAFEPGSILVAEDITPTQAALLRPGQVSAIVTATGNSHSHATILARASRIPTVVSTKGLLDAVRDSDQLIVDGGTGEVIVCPTSEEIQRYMRRGQQQNQVRQRLEVIKTQKTVTRDAKRVEVGANLSQLRELNEIVEKGVDGIGLFRTETLYLDSDTPPGEQQQFLTYKAIVRALKNKPVTVCTADMGGEWEAPYLGLGREPNPSMGLRPVRYSLANEEMFKVQLTALLRASAFGNIQIMVPLITSLGELRRVRDLLEECKEDLMRRQIDFDPNIRLGVVIETPAAAIKAADLAKEADFFSLGTDDLTQYTLAVDRGNRRVASLYSTFHPAVLKLIHNTIAAAAEAYIPVGICGEAAADPMMMPFLIGSGISQLSVRPSALLGVREQIANLNYLYWRERVPEILQITTPEEVVDYIKLNWSERTEDFGLRHRELVAR